MNLKDKIAWITGGGSGIGLAGAIELAKAGCRVVISGRDAAKLDAAVRQAESQGAPAGSVSALPLDVADSAAVARRGAGRRRPGSAASTSWSTAPASTFPSATGTRPTAPPSTRWWPST